MTENYWFQLECQWLKLCYAGNAASICQPASPFHSSVEFVEPMKKYGLILLLLFTLGLVFFSTWQLYAGNLPAAFSTVPFLLITYLFVIRFKR